MNNLLSNFSKANRLLDGNVSIFLDFIRGISAILVVMEHLSSRLFVGYGNVDNPNVLTKVLYLLNILGGPAVIIFFVLSGLFISRSVIKAVLEDKWSWKTYLINRLTRLMVVLVPALILTLILDMIAVQLFGYQGYKSIYLNLTELFGNLFFLQNIFVDVYGSNAPLWSLNYEFWYYMLFPMLFLLIFRKGRIVPKLIYAVIVLLILSTIGIRMNSYFVIWLIGTSVLLLPRIDFLVKGFTPLVAFVLVFLAVPLRPLIMTGELFTESWTEDLFFIDLVIGLTFGFLIYTMLHILAEKVKNVELKSFGKLSKVLASFSFSLYLIHYPIINTVYYWSAWNGFTGFQPNILTVLLELGILILICLIAFFFARLTEANTHVIRNILMTKSKGTDRNRRRKDDKKQRVAG